MRCAAPKNIFKINAVYNTNEAFSDDTWHSNIYIYYVSLCLYDYVYMFNGGKISYFVLTYIFPLVLLFIF